MRCDEAIAASALVAVRTLSVRCYPEESVTLKDVKQEGQANGVPHVSYELAEMSDIFDGRSSALIAASRCKAALLLS